MDRPPQATPPQATPPQFPGAEAIFRLDNLIMCLLKMIMNESTASTQVDFQTLKRARIKYSIELTSRQEPMTTEMSAIRECSAAGISISDYSECLESASRLIQQMFTFVTAPQLPIRKEVVFDGVACDEYDTYQHHVQTAANDKINDLSIAVRYIANKLVRLREHAVAIAGDNLPPSSTASLGEYATAREIAKHLCEDFESIRKRLDRLNERYPDISREFGVGASRHGESKKIFRTVETLRLLQGIEN